ncbi:MAG TPA: Rid family detoxifying hydrolase [Smithellaceae bacterium]|nr:Rid family detoxifying hydrolase [Smithellaceae bacterium]HRS88939.1 Rid family detoxifying hydrolase [Smithellaceae bacterium]HRV25555.1 Rid family detoxifying hydrolase [Smithellaceae bacterium]
MEKIIHKSAHSPALGPYSTAVEVGDLIFISGQLGIDPQSGEPLNDINQATSQSLTSIRTILSEIGLDMRNIVRTTIYLKNMADFPAVNEIYAEFFPADPPARSTVEVSHLPKGALIEIDAIATR